MPLLLRSYFRYAETVLLQMNQSIVTLTSWMAANLLLFNPSKTQAIWLGGHIKLAKIDCQRLTSLFPHITFSTSVRHLGVMLDPELTLSHHINLVARQCSYRYRFVLEPYYQLGQLRVVSRSLTYQSRLTLVHACVTSRIDTCCCLLPWYLGPAGPSSALGCPACWRVVQVLFHHCLHA